MDSFPAYRAALFDLDGTLTRTFIDFEAMRGDLRRLADAADLTDAIARTDDILEIAARLGALGGAKLYVEAMRLLERREQEGCARPEPIEGAIELLRQLRDERGIPVAIITRNCRAVSEDLLRRMNLPHDLLIAREDTQEFKPHPEPLLRACRALAISPSETFMAGDLWADIAAGRAAQVAATIGIRWPYLPVDRFARCPPDFEVTSLIEASSLILGRVKNATPGRPFAIRGGRNGAKTFPPRTGRSFPQCNRGPLAPGHECPFVRRRRDDRASIRAVPCTGETTA